VQAAEVQAAEAQAAEAQAAEAQAAEAQAAEAQAAEVQAAEVQAAEALAPEMSAVEVLVAQTLNPSEMQDRPSGRHHRLLCRLPRSTRHSVTSSLTHTCSTLISTSLASTWCCFAF
jgi:hypothetical protein